ncbi:tetratricopeptide repeat protein [Anabaena cylindrica FACHB-243]|uniref:Tetratricopeptide TPR_1 repeat-containing protein n=1 Tax=Anabaena cylindrica (strain ATCC 27899 / PCC 7122) TaxID=272123 RepID=K9ZKE6_ANACC|nr:MULTISPECIES: tetratricopeptide repeat protein [Anabaena]AFZ59234.1 Tetratricopeptide TPR_1 repeat-containing protein [Anabaena cylindrica PCC 7122]MBD2416584.1 tetratricopeptide repeat protein [Anabaena cylindrica FACHB-243]MBY5280917.1 tetratricopeptide repeat protein [Anabaena sp. CCAP 1446/1C]MBY5310548.1 tetratricopeptide repeat protein [Anabaena sp. CCAP 1446/1C]MCM2407524.1 tetratricopeptide repeat protein [Anabaena sp. CCAP 1446/1C]
MNIGCCLIDLWEIEDAIKIFEEGCIFISNNINIIDNQYILESWCLLAFLNSHLGFNQKASEFAEKAYSKLVLTECSGWSAWSQGYGLLFLGLTYKNLHSNKESFEMYDRAISFAEQSNYTQVTAKALTGLAELYRIQGDFETALFHHSESIELLDKIGAKCDLAEAYYQLGLTYQKMGETENSHTNFNEAIRLFNEMEALKQVEKVEKAKIQN